MVLKYSASLVAQLVKNLCAMQEMSVLFLGWEDPLEKGLVTHSTVLGLPWWFSSKESASNTGDSGDAGLIPGSGRSPGGGNGKPLQYSYLENPTDREAWRATVYEVAKSQTQLSTHIIYWDFLL